MKSDIYAQIRCVPARAAHPRARRRRVGHDLVYHPLTEAEAEVKTPAPRGASSTASPRCSRTASLFKLAPRTQAVHGLLDQFTGVKFSRKLTMLDACETGLR